MENHDLADRVAQLLAEPGPLGIVRAGDPVLRQKTASHDGQLGDDVLRQLIGGMRETMEKTHNAVGLAAPQVGLPLRLAVPATPEALTARLIESGQQPVSFTVLINPSYEAAGGPQTMSFEGCLSVSGWQAVVARPDRIRLTREDETGRRLWRCTRGSGQGSCSMRRTTSKGCSTPTAASCVPCPRRNRWRSGGARRDWRPLPSSWASRCRNQPLS